MYSDMYTREKRHQEHSCIQLQQVIHFLISHGASKESILTCEKTLTTQMENLTRELKQVAEEFTQLKEKEYSRERESELGWKETQELRLTCQFEVLTETYDFLKKEIKNREELEKLKQQEEQEKLKRQEELAKLKKLEEQKKLKQAEAAKKAAKPILMSKAAVRTADSITDKPNFKQYSSAQSGHLGRYKPTIV
jgi:hypothetical protein